MHLESVVHSRPDREITKRIISPGDYSIVPYEESRCTISLTNIQCTNVIDGNALNPESRLFGKDFDGIVLIGDSDSYIDKDLEWILQQMCCGETCVAKIVYKNKEGEIINEISCQIELKEVTEEQLVCNWSWAHLFEAAAHHKERGVMLINEKRTIDAFRRFSKAFKLLVAIKPVDPEVISDDSLKEIMELKVKLYNNLAHCQLQFNEYEAALVLCNKAIQHEPNNLKALYRRSVSYHGLKMYQEAWMDIQKVLTLKPNDKAARIKARELKMHLEKINEQYTSVIKKMFG